MTLQSSTVGVGKRLVTAVVALVVFEVVGLGLYLVVMRPQLLGYLLDGETPYLSKIVAVLGSPVLLLVTVALAALAIAYAIRSDPASGTESPSTDDASADADPQFSFGDGGDAGGPDDGGFSFGGESE